MNIVRKGKFLKESGSQHPENMDLDPQPTFYTCFHHFQYIYYPSGPCTGINPGGGETTHHTILCPCNFLLCIIKTQNYLRVKRDFFAFNRLESSFKTYQSFIFTLVDV